MLGTLGKNFSRHLWIFFLFFPENRFWHFMQIVSIGENLHEMSKPVFWEEKKEKYFKMLSAELAKRVVKVKRWGTNHFSSKQLFYIFLLRKSVQESIETSCELSEIHIKCPDWFSLKKKKINNKNIVVTILYGSSPIPLFGQIQDDKLIYSTFSHFPRLTFNANCLLRRCKIHWGLMILSQDTLNFNPWTH